MASADELGAPAAPPGGPVPRDATERVRWLPPLGLALVVLQVVLADLNDSWHRNALTVAGEVAVAVLCVVLLAAVLHRHGYWRPALAALPLTALLWRATWGVLQHGSSMTVLDALVLLLSPLVGLSLVFAALVRGERRLVVAAAVVWLPVPPALLLT